MAVWLLAPGAYTCECPYCGWSVSMTDLVAALATMATHGERNCCWTPHDVVLADADLAVVAA